MRRGAGICSVGPASSRGEVAEGPPGALTGSSRPRGSGLNAGSPDDVFEAAGFPVGRDGTPRSYRILAVGSKSVESGSVVRCSRPPCRASGADSLRVAPGFGKEAPSTGDPQPCGWQPDRAAQPGDCSCPGMKLPPIEHL